MVGGVRPLAVYGQNLGKACIFLTAVARVYARAWCLIFITYSTEQLKRGVACRRTEEDVPGSIVLQQVYIQHVSCSNRCTYSGVLRQNTSSSVVSVPSSSFELLRIDDTVYSTSSLFQRHARVLNYPSGISYACMYMYV